MKINMNEIDVKRIGEQKGTIGWLAENADHIVIGPMGGAYAGILGAWLCDTAGNKLQYLASLDNVAPMMHTEYLGKWTDAAWEIIKELEKLATELLNESEEDSRYYTVQINDEG